MQPEEAKEAESKASESSKVNDGTAPIDTSKIYPTATQGIGAVTPTSEVPKSSKTLVTTRGTVAEVIFSFIVGLLGFTVLGMIIGLTLNGAAITPENPDGWVNADLLFNSYVFLPVFLLIFGPLAYMTRNILYLVYPFIAMGVAASFVKSDFVLWLGGWVPFVEPAQRPQFVENLIAVMLAYMTIYAIAGPLQSVKGMYRTVPSSYKTTFIATNLSIVAIVLLVLPALAATDGRLYDQQRLSRTGVRIPVTETMFAQPTNSKNPYYIQYARDTSKVNVSSWASADRVGTYALEEWWNRDTKEVCGQGIVDDGQQATYAYKQTPGGIQYAQAVLERQGQSPPVKSRQYKEFYNCFVIDYHKYALIRTETNGLMEEYPTDKVIDAIAAGERYIPACLGTQDNTGKVRYPGSCTEGDKATIATLTKQAEQFAANEASRHPPVNVVPPSYSPAAYQAAGRVTVQEWGVTVPYTQELADMYYVMSPDGTRANIRVKSFQGIDPEGCGENIGHMTRIKVSDVKPVQGSTRPEGWIVGEYVYMLKTDLIDTAWCKNTTIGTASLNIAAVQDILNWMSVGVQKSQ